MELVPVLGSTSSHSKYLILKFEHCNTELLTLKKSGVIWDNYSGIHPAPTDSNALKSSLPAMWGSTSRHKHVGPANR
jgi:hypothetical protein